MGGAGAGAGAMPAGCINFQVRLGPIALVFAFNYPPYAAKHQGGQYLPQSQRQVSITSLAAEPTATISTASRHNGECYNCARINLHLRM